MKLFGLSETRAFAQRLGRELEIAVAAHEEREFADGEFKIRALDDVRGERVLVCQSLARDATLTTHDKLWRLVLFCGGLKDAGAAHVTAVLPYCAYGRKDRRTQPQDPIATRYLAQGLEVVGVDAVATLEAHSVAAFDNAFRIPKLHVDAAPPFVAHFAPRIAAAAKVVVVSPDLGGVTRARGFAGQLARASGRDVGIAFVEKQRSGGRVTGELFAGHVDGAVAIVYDDLVSSGATLARAAEACAARGAVAVHAAAAHGVLAPEGAAALAPPPLVSLVLTDSVADVEERCAALALERHVLGCASLFAGALRAAAIAR